MKVFIKFSTTKDNYDSRCVIRPLFLRWYLHAPDYSKFNFEIQWSPYLVLCLTNKVKWKYCQIFLFWQNILILQKTKPIDVFNNSENKLLKERKRDWRRVTARCWFFKFSGLFINLMVSFHQPWLLFWRGTFR